MIRRILVGGLYIGIVSFTLFYILIESGMDEYSARNTVLLLMVLFENVHVFNSRTETNFLHKIDYKKSLLLIYLVIFTQFLHLACMHIPFMQDVLSVEPVSFETWSMLLALALGLVVVLEADKWVQFKKRDTITKASRS
jgi:magnesium-transporting ATPase (P-type)